MTPIERYLEAAGKATEGPWSLWTSCSWRRIGSDSAMRTVIEPTVLRDGHPDLIFRNGGQDGPDVEFVLAARNASADIEKLYERNRELLDPMKFPRTDSGGTFVSKEWLDEIRELVG